MVMAAGRQRRWRLWSGRLWILSLGFGIATIVSTVSLVHDNTRRDEAGRLVARTTAQQVAVAIRERSIVNPGVSAAMDSLPLDSARRIAAAVLGDILAREALLARIDTLSIRILRSDGRVLFGSLGAQHSLRGTASLQLAGREAVVEVAITPGQVPLPLSMPARRTDLAHNGLLILTTVIVTLLAFHSARREAALARARGDFIAGVSHDLRMPLAQILLAGETLLLRDDVDETERATLTVSVVRETKRLIGMVENILLFSRASAVEMSPRRELFQVAPLLEETAESMRAIVADAGQSIVVRGDPAIVARGDTRLVRQAIVNFVDNAVKYGSAGQVITIEASRGDGVARISVADRGPGIPHATSARLFEAYERLPADESSERTGMGLGLAVVDQIARASGGRAWLDDAPGGGTRAVLELPV